MKYRRKQPKSVFTATSCANHAGKIDVASDDGWTACISREAFERDYEPIPESTAQEVVGRALDALEPQHHCGVSGYNPMIDEPCPGCAAREAAYQAKRAGEGRS